jgi:DNA modification methylase
VNIRDRIKELRRVPADQLQPNPKNWRKHPESQANALRGVLAEVGIASAVLARETPEGGLMLIDGHLRTETLHNAEIPVLVLDVTEEEADKILATFDPLGAMAESDADALRALLEEVETGSQELADMLTALAEDAGILDGENAAEIIEDEVPEPPVDPITKPGDLWILGDHRLLCGDSTKAEDVERLMNGAKINVAFTSPPYASQRKYDESSGFKPIPPDEYVEWFSHIQENVRKFIVEDGSWFVNIKEHCEDGQRSLYVKDLAISHVRTWGWCFIDELCWKRNSIPGLFPGRFKNLWEPIFHFSPSPGTGVKCDHFSVAEEGNGFQYEPGLVKRLKSTGSEENGAELKARGVVLPGNVLEFNSDSSKEQTGHSAPFPVKLPSFFIRAYSDKGDSVYEPFCGSGTTLIAAEQLGRKCYGMEISPQYCDVIVKRWETLTGRQAERRAGR